MNIRIAKTTISSIIAIACISVFLGFTGTQQKLEGKILNTWFSIRGEAKDSKEIVIVGIDENSIRQFGDWPWNRSLLASLLIKVCEAEPSLAVFDITFSHKEETTAEEAATDSLAKVATKFGNVLFPYFFEEEDRIGVVNVYAPPDEIRATEYQVQENFKLNQKEYISAKRLISSSLKLTSGGKAGGHISRIVETDGTCRRDAHVLLYGRSLLPSLAVTVLEKKYNRAFLTKSTDADLKIIIGETQIPVDETGCSYLNYYGGKGTFTTVSAGKLLQGENLKETLKNKIVLIGLTSHGLSDIYGTPYVKHLPTVEKMATSIDNALSKSWIVRKRSFFAIELGVLIIMGVGAVLCVVFLNSTFAVLAAVGSGFLCAAYSYVAFANYSTWLRFGFASLCPVVIVVLTLVIQWKITFKSD